jgi:hypothetical protein
VREALADRDQETRDAAGITVSELLENAMKYGSSVPGMPQVEFTLIVGDDEVRIEVSNGVESLQSIAEVCAHIEAISAGSNKEALYVARVQKLVDAQDSRTQLGLLRIAYEAGFDLSYQHADRIITVAAWRSFQRGPSRIPE